MDAFIPQAFKSRNWDYPGTEAEIKERIRSDLRIYQLNKKAGVATGSLELAVTRMSEHITKAEFEEYAQQAIDFIA